MNVLTIIGILFVFALVFFMWRIVDRGAKKREQQYGENFSDAM